MRTCAWLHLYAHVHFECTMHGVVGDTDPTYDTTRVYKMKGCSQRAHGVCLLYCATLRLLYRRHDIVQDVLNLRFYTPSELKCGR